MGPSQLASGPSWARLDRLDAKRCAKDKRQMLLLLICQQYCSQCTALFVLRAPAPLNLPLQKASGEDTPPQETNTNMSCIIAAVWSHAQLFASQFGPPWPTHDVILQLCHTARPLHTNEHTRSFSNTQIRSISSQACTQPAERSSTCPRRIQQQPADKQAQQ